MNSLDNRETNNSNAVMGNNIRKVRKGLNLTQEQFAEKLDINAQFLSQVENGKTGLSISNVINICKIAGCAPNKLFKDIVEIPNVIEKYDLLNTRDQSIINQMIEYLLNT